MSENANDGVRLFAKAGITAALTINSGALIAVLSQFDKLGGLPADNLAAAFRWWSFGVTAAAVTWVLATLVAGYHANNKRRAEIRAGWFAYVVLILSIACFAMGALEIASGLKG